MRTVDRLLLVGLTLVWGLNFSVIKIALLDFPPLLLGTLRFALVALPAVALLPRPTAPWRHVAAYGLTMFALQFSLLFAGLALGVGAGVASLLAQVQVFATMGLALWFGRERPAPHQWLGVTLGAAGIGGLVLAAPAGASAAGIACVLLAGLSWGVANTVSRRLLPGQAVLPLVAWGSLASVPPVATASLMLEGWPAWQAAFTHAHAAGWWAVAYIAYLSTLAGFALWAAQLRRHPAAAVAPFTMLVPVFGLLFAVPLLGEALTPLKLAAAVLVLLGVAVTHGGRAFGRWLQGRHRETV